MSKDPEHKHPTPASTAQTSYLPGPSRAPTAQSTPIDNPGLSRAQDFTHQTTAKEIATTDS